MSSPAEQATSCAWWGGELIHWSAGNDSPVSSITMGLESPKYWRRRLSGFGAFVESATLWLLRPSQFGYRKGDGVWSWNILVVLWELQIHWYQSNLKTQIIGLFNLPVSIISPKIMVEKVADNQCQQVITILCERFVCEGFMCMQQPLISFGLRHLWVNPLVWLITACVSISSGHFSHYSWPT